MMPFGEIKKGIAEPSVGKLKIGSVVQFERFGFCCKVKKDLFFFAHK